MSGGMNARAVLSGIITVVYGASSHQAIGESNTVERFVHKPEACTPSNKVSVISPTRLPDEIYHAHPGLGNDHL